MPEYRWTGDGVFRDGRSGETVASGETLSLDAHAGDTHPELVRVETSDDDGSAGDDEPETCQVVKTDGEVCGRPKPCRYHSED